MLRKTRNGVKNAVQEEAERTGNGWHMLCEERKSKMTLRSQSSKEEVMEKGINQKKWENKSKQGDIKDKLVTDQLR